MNTRSLPQVSILGCGWLGLPLAEKLLEKHYPVKGSTTQTEKLQLLKNSGVEPYLLTLFEDRIEGDIRSFLSGSEILIIDIPPGLRSDPDRNFPLLLKNLLRELAPLPIKHILYISSTSVFPDTEAVFEEDDHPEPDSASGKQLLQAEEMIRTEGRENTIVRFGGLIGPGRHPVNFLSGREHMEGGGHKINLIHLEDCIGIIAAILDQKAWNRVFHGVAPYHPTKKTYYTAIAEQRDLPLPGYMESSSGITGKEISSRKTTGILNYTFRKPFLGRQVGR